MHPLPRPENCTVEPVIVGDSNGMQIGDGYRVIVRDSQNRPIEGTQVSVNFQQGVFPYQQQFFPGAGVDCAAIILSQVSDVNGVATFIPRIGGSNLFPVMAVKGDGVFLAQISGRSTDLDASGATDAFDFNHFRINFLTNPSAPETDYNEDGVTDAFDFNLFRQ